MQTPRLPPVSPKEDMGSRPGSGHRVLLSGTGVISTPRQPMANTGGSNTTTMNAEQWAKYAGTEAELQRWTELKGAGVPLCLSATTAKATAAERRAAEAEKEARKHALAVTKAKNEQKEAEARYTDALRQVQESLKRAEERARMAEVREKKAQADADYARTYAEERIADVTRETQKLVAESKTEAEQRIVSAGKLAAEREVHAEREVEQERVRADRLMTMAQARVEAAERSALVQREGAERRARAAEEKSTTAQDKAKQSSRGASVAAGKKVRDVQDSMVEHSRQAQEWRDWVQKEADKKVQVAEQKVRDTIAEADERVAQAEVRVREAQEREARTKASCDARVEECEQRVRDAQAVQAAGTEHWQQQNLKVQEIAAERVKTLMDEANEVTRQHQAHLESMIEEFRKASQEEKVRFAQTMTLYSKHVDQADARRDQFGHIADERVEQVRKAADDQMQEVRKRTENLLKDMKAELVLSKKIHSERVDLVEVALINYMYGQETKAQEILKGAAETVDKANGVAAITNGEEAKKDATAPALTNGEQAAEPEMQGGTISNEAIAELRSRAAQMLQDATWNGALADALKECKGEQEAQTLCRIQLQF